MLLRTVKWAYRTHIPTESKKMAAAPPQQPGKLLFQEGSMLGGSFAMVRFYDVVEDQQEEEGTTIIRLVVSDRATGATAPYDFDQQDLSSLEKQLNSSPGEAKQKPFLKQLAKCLIVVRKETSLQLSFKGLVILTSEEKEQKKLQLEQEKLEQERLALLEQERLQRVLEERLENERLAALREEAERERIANLTPEQREHEALMKNAAYLDQLTLLIDMVDLAIEQDFIELKRPIITHARRKQQKNRAPSTFKKMTLQEEAREEEKKQPRGQVDQDWDDPLELLAEYKHKTQEKHVAQSVFQQLSEMQRKQKLALAAEPIIAAASPEEEVAVAT